MNRRGFLATLFGTAAATMLLPHIDIPAEIVLTRESEALSSPLWQGTFQAALEEAHRMFLVQMRGLGFDVRPEHVSDVGRMGEGTPEGIILRDWRNVTASTTGRESCLEPAMRAMTEALAYRGTDRFGTLQLPQAVEFAGTRGPLRMVVAYSIVDGAYLTRFDVIGGSSPIGERIGRRVTADRTKRLIRRRIGTYPNPSRLPA